MKLIRKMPRRIFSFLNPINRHIKKDPEQIFLYSNLGFRDNIKALFDHLIEQNYNNDYKIVVSVNDYLKYDNISEKNVTFTDCKKGLFEFFKSKYCFYCFGKYPVKPAPGQIVFNLWHGMPLKRIGNLVRGCEKTDYNYFTHLLCTSEFFRETMKKAFSCTDDAIVICGQPRTDIMMTDMQPGKEREMKSQIFGFDGRKYRILLWLPTFRENDESELDILSDEQFEKLDELCAQKSWKLIIKPHPLSKINTDNLSRYSSIRVITTEQLTARDIDFYKLIKFSDALITDYSSVYFDYMMLDKPIGFVVSDMERYDEERGFIFENPKELMPGNIIRNGSEFMDFAEEIMNGADKFRDKRHMLNDKFNTYQDNRNCERVLQTVGIKRLGKYY